MVQIQQNVGSPRYLTFRGLRHAIPVAIRDFLWPAFVSRRTFVTILLGWRKKKTHIAAIALLYTLESSKEPHMCVTQVPSQSI